MRWLKEEMEGRERVPRDNREIRTAAFTLYMAERFFDFLFTFLFVVHNNNGG